MVVAESPGDEEKSPSSVMKLIKEKQVLVFSKSYCPHCAKTKELLAEKEITPHVVEIDFIEGGGQMIVELQKITD